MARNETQKLSHTMPGTATTRRGFVALVGGTLGAALLAPGTRDALAAPELPAPSSPDMSAADDQAGDQATGIDYLVLVNKQHELPEGWEDALELVHFKNTEGWDVDVEAKAYDAYLGLKEELEAEGVYVDLDSAYRSVAEQQRIVEEFTEDYGEEYVRLYVAVPGYSEHHTGLALDLFLVIDGKGVYLNEEMVQHPEIWEVVHSRLADHGFILRYLPGKKIFTGYSYEPWHIRYVGDAEVAHQIMDAGLTLEEYIDAVEPCVAGCTVDYGTSELYAEPDMDSALDRVLEEFRGWTGCTMQHVAFAGDDACGPDEVAYLNSLCRADATQADAANEGAGEDAGADEDAGESAFDQAIVFVTDFHSPSEEQAVGTAWNPDADYVGYTWHLGRTGADGAWQLLTWGY